MAPEASKWWCFDGDSWKFQALLASLKVASEGAERSVKLMQDYAGFVKDEKLLQDVL